MSDAQIIWDNSIEYRGLWIEKLNRLNGGEYYFLNSYEYAEIIGRLSIIEEAVLTETKNIKLLNEYKTEKLLHEKREIEMLISIYDIATQHPFEKSVFICGAEHRQSIRKKIKEFEIIENNRIKWTFFNKT